MLRALAAGLALVAALSAQGQTPPHAQGESPAPANGLFLVAKPGLLDPNFSRTVVLVTQTEDFRTIGVIINRPTDIPVSIPGLPTPHYDDKLYTGGPVSRSSIVAVFRSTAAPKSSALRVLRNVWLTQHKDNVAALAADAAAKYRLYVGYSAWAPRQLESEMHREGWFILPADEATIFREDMSSLWDELVAKASGPRAGLSWNENAPHGGGASPGLPGVPGVSRAVPPERHGFGS